MQKTYINGIYANSIIILCNKTVMISMMVTKMLHLSYTVARQFSVLYFADSGPLDIVDSLLWPELSPISESHCVYTHMRTYIQLIYICHPILYLVSIHGP